MAERLLKVWDNWGDGMGFPVDGEHNGFFGLLDDNNSLGSLMALPKELRPGRYNIDTTINLSSPILDSFSTQGGNAYNLYIIARAGAASGNLSKIKITSSGTFTDRSSISYSTYLGTPEQYGGKWYFSELATNAVIRKLTTSTDAVISSDTIDAGDAGSGNGYLNLIGHQLAKLQPSLGVSILATGTAATANANWGSPFPVGDSSDTEIGIASVSGLTYVLRSTGIYTFNDRGRAGLVHRDFIPFSQVGGPKNLIRAWKDGIVFASNAGLFYFRPGEYPYNIGLESLPQFHTSPPDVGDNILSNTSLDYLGLNVIGDYIYAAVSNAAITDTAFLLVGEAIDGDPRRIRWNNWGRAGYLLSSTDIGFGFAPALNTGLAFGTADDDFILYRDTSAGDSSKLAYTRISSDGSPFHSSSTTRLAPSEGYLPELFFPQGVRPTRIVVYTFNMDDDATTPDQWQLRAVFNNRNAGSSGVNIGAPIYANGKHEVLIDSTEDVYRLMLGLKFNCNTANARKSPYINRIELYGAAQ